MKELKYYILIAIIGLIAGFYLGRETIEPQYVKGETLRDTAYIPLPLIMPSKEIKYKAVYEKDKQGKVTKQLDTLASEKETVLDWNLNRQYSDVLFDNEKGRFQYDINIQNNELKGFKYQFTPLYQRLPPKEKVWQPFISASYSTLDYVGVGGGIFYHNLGFEYQYQYQYKESRNGHLFGLKYKF